MGFSTLIDIMGSVVIGGMILMILLRLNDAAIKNSFEYNGDLIVQENLTEIVLLLEHDFRKIGYSKDWLKIPNPSKSIISADQTDISFLTDIEPDGIVDTLRYYLGTRAELSHTENPRDRMFYRQINSGTPVGANLGVTQFDLTYFNTLGAQIPTPVPVPGEIQTIQIDLTVEGTSGYFSAINDTTVDTLYASTFWRQIRLAARNLGNR